MGVPPTAIGYAIAPPHDDVIACRCIRRLWYCSAAKRTPTKSHPHASAVSRLPDWLADSSLLFLSLYHRAVQECLSRARLKPRIAVLRWPGAFKFPMKVVKEHSKQCPQQVFDAAESRSKPKTKGKRPVHFLISSSLVVRQRHLFLLLLVLALQLCHLEQAVMSLGSTQDTHSPKKGTSCQERSKAAYSKLQHS
ncbi:hypothetical protein MTO96_001914 [Rhipicephalus appendiculatus]